MDQSIMNIQVENLVVNRVGIPNVVVKLHFLVNNEHYVSFFCNFVKSR